MSPKLALSKRWLILLALLAATNIQLSSCFNPNYVYRYEFQGAITTKVADDDKPQYSGLSLSSPLLVKRTASNELTVRLEKPQLATFNDVIEDIHLYQYNYKPLKDEQANSLDKSFRIYFEDGAVKSFDTYKDEPKWVTNFKRGLLAFFQLRLSGFDSASSGDNAASGDNNNNQRSTTATGRYYTTTEKSVFGECETDYLVLPVDGGFNVTKTRNMAKCKTRYMHRFMPIDSSECYENDKELQQYKHSNSIFNYHLLGNEQDYTVEQVLLDEAWTFSPFGQKAHSHLVHSKFMLKLKQQEDGGSMTGVENGATRIDSLSYDPAEMLNFYANINLEDEHHLSNIYQSRASVDQVMQAFDQLVGEHRTYTAAFEGSNSMNEQLPINYQQSSRLAELFIRLNELVGTLNLQKIEQLYSQVDDRGEAHKKIFWDVMSVVGTNPSFMFMKKLITEGDAPSVKIKDFLTRLSYHIKMPSKSLFDEYVSLCKSDKIQTNQQYKRLCSLPLASLIHQHCAKPHAKYLRTQQEGANATVYKKAQNTCQIATAEEYFTRLVNPIQGPASSSGPSSGSSSGSSSSLSGSSSGGGSSSGSSASGGSGGSDVDQLSVGEKMFNIKMAGELGVKPSIEYLMEVVRNRDEHPTLRSAAMWNLKKATRIYTAQVKRLVIPYFYDQGELLELRLAALHNWFFAGMSLHEMETLSKQLQQEPSRQLVIYVHSMMKSLSELTTFPCSNGYEKSARLILPAINRALRNHGHPSATDSHASFSNTWQPEFGYGTFTAMSAIFSNESMAPSYMSYATKEIMSGLKLSPMSVTIQAHGLDKLIKRVVGINGLLADKESFMDVFSLKRRSKRQATAAELIKQEAIEIDKELKLGTREFSDVYLSVSINAYGRPITFFDKDSRELKKMLSEDGTVKVPQIKKLLHSFNNFTTQQMMITFEKLEVFNNELGLPLYQSINDFDYKTFKLNSVKVDVEPGFFKDERQGKPATKITAALDAKMGRHNEMFVSTGALMVANKQQIGVGFYKKKLLNIPLRMSLDANLLENKLTIKRQPIHENLLYIKQYPVTFVKSYDPSSSSSSSSSATDNQQQQQQRWLPLYEMNNTSHMKSFKLDYMTPLAVGLSLEGKHRLGQDWSMAAWRRHLSQVGLQAAKFMYFYSPTGQPLELRLSTATTQENPTKELSTVISWKHHHYHDHEGGSDSSSSSSSDLNEIEKQLEAFTSAGSSSAGQPSTVQYKLALIGGSIKERKVALDINYSRSFDKLLHKWRAFYQRTPLDQADPSSEVTNLCWIGQMQFPKYQIDKLLKFDLLDMDHSANMTNELTFGDECSIETKPADGTTARVSMKVNFDWSTEQRRLIEMALRAGDSSAQPQVSTLADPEQQQVLMEPKRNSYLQMYKKCLKQREKTGALLDSVCVHLLSKISELNHIQSSIDYKDVPERWTKMVSRLGSLYTYARAGYIDEMGDSSSYGKRNSATTTYKSADGKQDRAHLEANMTSSGGERKLSYEFNTPNYHVIYKNLPMSVPPLSTFPLLDSSYYQLMQKRLGSRSCSVSGNTVQTFDNLTFTMPNSIGDGCFKLITKDCSPESNFIVLGAKVGTGKVVKVYVAQKFKIEFIPDKEGKQISDIKVNGETVQIESGRAAAIRRDTKLGPRTVEAFTIENNGAYYTLQSKLYKFSVSTDGTWIFVQQSKYYASKSCGICGDANGDQLLEFKSPSSAKRICKTSDDFAWSYVIPSTCASRPANIECAA